MLARRGSPDAAPSRCPGGPHTCTAQADLPYPRDGYRYFIGRQWLTQLTSAPDPHVLQWTQR